MASRLESVYRRSRGFGIPREPHTDRTTPTQVGHIPYQTRYEPVYWLTDIVTTVTPPAVSQASDHELGLSEFPPVCASNERAEESVNEGACNRQGHRD